MDERGGRSNLNERRLLEQRDVWYSAFQSHHRPCQHIGLPEVNRWHADLSRRSYRQLNHPTCSTVAAGGILSPRTQLVAARAVQERGRKALRSRQCAQPGTTSPASWAAFLPRRRAVSGQRTTHPRPGSWPGVPLSTLAFQRRLDRPLAMSLRWVDRPSRIPGPGPHLRDACVEPQSMARGVQGVAVPRNGADLRGTERNGTEFLGTESERNGVGYAVSVSRAKA